MRKTVLFFFLTVSCNLLYSNKIKKAYKALKEYNYFEAKRLFEKKKKKHLVASSFGLSTIYGRNDNPFYNLDSAYTYILSADTAFWHLNQKQIEKLSNYQVDSMAIQNWKDTVDRKAFDFAKKRNKIEIYQTYIDIHSDSYWKVEAIKRRNFLAFTKAKQKNSSIALLNFKKEYPNAIEVIESNSLINKLQFKEATPNKTAQEYYNFCNKYPNSPYFREAEDSVYSIFCKEGAIKNYENFISRFPKNGNVNKAWRNIYKLYSADYSPQRIVEFKIDYPKYPFADELMADIKLAATVFYRFKQNGLFGFMDRSGKIRIAPKYSYAEPFVKGMALVISSSKVGYINKLGETVIPFEYDDAFSFDGEVAIVSKKESYGMINRTNTIVCPLKFDLIEPFQNNLALAANDTAYGFIDRNGKERIAFSFESATDFEDGYSIVQKNGLKGLIDTNGVMLIPAIYNQFTSSTITGLYIVKNDSLYGLTNSKGDTVVSLSYNKIGRFNNGLAYCEKGAKYGYINTSGIEVIPLKFKVEKHTLIKKDFENGYAKYSQKNKIGLIDTLGVKFFPAVFEDVGLVMQSDLVAVKKRGKWGFSDKDVNLKIPYEFTQVSGFKYGYTAVKNDSAFAIIDLKGEYLYEPKFDVVNWINDSVFIAKNKQEFGLLTTKKDTLIPFIYSSIKKEGSRLILSREGGESLYFLKENEMVVPKR